MRTIPGTVLVEVPSMTCFNGLADDDNDASGNRAEVSLASPYSFCEHAGREELGVMVATIPRLWGFLALLLKPYGRQSSERPFRPCR